MPIEKNPSATLRDMLPEGCYIVYQHNDWIGRRMTLIVLPPKDIRDVFKITVPLTGTGEDQTEALQQAADIVINRIEDARRAADMPEEAPFSDDEMAFQKVLARLSFGPDKPAAGKPEKDPADDNEYGAAAGLQGFPQTSYVPLGGGKALRFDYRDNGYPIGSDWRGSIDISVTDELRLSTSQGTYDSKIR